MKERVSIFVLIAAVLLWFGITAHSTDTNSEFIVTDDPVLVPEAPE